jgi:hypothetical protein
MLPRCGFERAVLDSAAGKATAAFLNGEVVFRGITLRPRVASEKASDRPSEEVSAQESEKMSEMASQSMPDPTIPEIDSDNSGSNNSGNSGYSTKKLVKSTINRPKTRPRKCRKKRPNPRRKVAAFSDAFIAKTGRAPTGQEIRTQFPDVPRQTAHDYSVRARARVEIGNSTVISLEQLRLKVRPR